MENSLYPGATLDIAKKREQLTPGIAEHVARLQPPGVRRRSTAGKDQGSDRSRRSTCDAMPLLHTCPH